MRLDQVARNLREWAAWQTERQRLLALRTEGLIPPPIIDHLLVEVDRNIHLLEVPAS